MDNLNSTRDLLKLIGQLVVGAVLFPVIWVWRKVAGR